MTVTIYREQKLKVMFGPLLKESGVFCSITIKIIHMNSS